MVKLTALNEVAPRCCNNRDRDTNPTEGLMPGKRTVPRVCEQCHELFMARTDTVAATGAKYCSRSCSNRARFAANRPTLTCEYCGKLFIAPPRDAKNGRRFCSLPCGIKKNPATNEERFWTNVDKNGPGGCWLWTGRVDPGGYGTINLANGGQNRAHRFAYELLIGPIPKGLQLDHVYERGCRFRHCVNPDHLEPVTQRENLIRGMHPAMIVFREKVCAKGHAITPENSYKVTTKHGTRFHCRTCAVNRLRKRTGWKGTEGQIKGEAVPLSKLTEQSVKEIRHRYRAGGVTLAQLGMDYNVHLSTIRSVVHRKTWKHVA